MKYDLVVFGGGTSGIASAYIASKHGLKTLLVEKSDVLGGSITQSLVIPCMKVDSNNLNIEFINDLKAFADKYGARHTYIDGNEYWFNPELLKIVFDDMLTSVNCTILFSSEPVKIKKDTFEPIYNIKLEHKMLSLYIESKYIVDATANGKIFKLLNKNFQEFSDNPQTPSLRFIIGNIDINIFFKWIENKDANRNVTTIDRTANQIYLSTAYTWDSDRKWALKDIFDLAVKNGDIEYSDTAYFQVFSVPSMPNTLAFNCPRILLEDETDILDPYTYSRALKQGRERIYRLYSFCKKYFPGFDNSYIIHIADMLGVRESYRIKGKYTITKDDIIHSKKFNNVAFYCDYPIDIHSNKKDKGKLEYIKHTYEVPIECLICEDDDNLFAVGRIISADFEAQAALRTQISCFSMGEAASKEILKRF